MADVQSRLTVALDDRYRVQRQIGAGGMATVYLAHDLRHERDVAIKVLHPDLAAALGAERFLAEIKTTAKLQHPHILPLLDSGEADGLLYYVMPFISGETLRTRLERETQLAIDDAVRIAREVASALESAHRHGVVHRDIKPENILIHEDQALVADFGIALAVSAAGGSRMTQTGLSLGTPAYMAPEQAMGERVVDGRADIYALGAVLYEMLVGEAPFTGPSVQAIVARVMTEQPRNLTGQRRSVPAHVNAVVLKALEKLPADRFHTAAEFGKALVTGETGASTQAATATAKTSRGDSRFSLADLIPWSITALALIAAGVFAVRVSSRPEPQVLHFSVDLPPDAEIPALISPAVGISDDGTRLAILVQGQDTRHLILHDLTTGESRPIDGSANVEGSAVFSPDGNWVAFGGNQSILRVPVSGGRASVIAGARWAHIAWLGNDSIVYAKSYDTGLYMSSVEGGDSVALTTPDRAKGELGHWWPQVLPDGEHVLFTAYRSPADRSTIEVLSLRNRERRIVFEGGYYGRVVGGRLLFVRGEAVMAVPFDVGARKVSGAVVPVGLDIATNVTNGLAAFSASSNGTLAYIKAGDVQTELKWIDERGNEESAVPEAGRYSEAVPSPVGGKIALVRDGDVYIYDLERRYFTRLTRTEQRETALVWTPDGREVLYARDVPQFDIFKRAIDGASPEVLVVTSSFDKIPTFVTPDGKSVLYNRDDASDDIHQVSLDGANDTTGQAVIRGPGDQSLAVLSRDGRWAVYVSDESGRFETYLTAYPVDPARPRQQISVSGGDRALWGPDGRTIYYRNVGRLYKVRVNPGTAEIGKPEEIMRVPVQGTWAIGRDGRFLIGKSAGATKRRTVKVVLNWPASLDRR